MSFPIRLPSHFAAFMFWLAVPGVVAGRLVAPEASNATSSRHTPRARELRLAGYGFLLILGVAATFHQSRRIAAAFCLKQGRIVASGPVIFKGTGGPAPAWELAEAQFSAGGNALATGNSARARDLFESTQVLMQSEAAREAESWFRRALQWDRRYPDASSRLGALLLMRGNADQAAAETRRTMRDLESCELWDRLGFACWFLGDRKGASEAWSVCLERRPAMAEYYRALIRHATP